MVNKLRRESQGLITVKIGDHEFPIAIRVGRKIYRVCPVCHNIFASANGWTKHMEKYHGEFFDMMLTYRFNELKELTKVTASKTGRECIDRLLDRLSGVDNPDVRYVEFNEKENGYEDVYKVDLKELIEFMKRFTCKELNIRYLYRDKTTGALRIGNRYFRGSSYFRVLNRNGKVVVRFVFKQDLMDAFISKATVYPIGHK